MLGATAQGQVDSTNVEDFPGPFEMMDPEDGPQFPGGELAMYDFIKEKLVYPEMWKGSGRKGKVYVEFLVQLDGTVTNERVLRGIDPEVNNEALRVVRSMPKWKPGTIKGKPIVARLVLPVYFKPE